AAEREAILPPRRQAVSEARTARALGVMTDDRALLTDIAKRLERLCVHVSVRDDDGTPFLFAVGLRHVHSLELRRKGEACIVELWRGPPNQDKFIAKEMLHSLEEAA